MIEQKPYTQHEKEFIERHTAEFKEYAIGDPVADQHIRFRKASFNIILGHANTGKTAWLVWTLVELSKRYALRHAVYSGENEIIELMAQLHEILTGVSRWDINPDSDEFKAASEFIEHHFYFVDDINTHTGPELLEAFENSGCDTCTIDPHNSVKVPQGLNWYQYSVELGIEIRGFLKRTNLILFMVAHPNTEAQRRVHKDGDFKGMKTIPNAPDIEGGGTWLNKADNFYIVHRYFSSPEHRNTTLVNVEKIKYQETGARPTLIDQPLRFFRANFGYTLERYAPSLPEEENEF